LHSLSLPRPRHRNRYTVVEQDKYNEKVPMARNSVKRTEVRTLPVIVPRMLARTLKAIRRRYHLTLREVADLTGVSAATYSRPFNMETSRSPVDFSRR
jgi:DNA-binding XRE family transcriptional regulator